MTVHCGRYNRMAPTYVWHYEAYCELSLISELTFKEHGRTVLKKGIVKGRTWSGQEGMSCRQAYLWTLHTASFHPSTVQVTNWAPQSGTHTQQCICFRPWIPPEESEGGQKRIEIDFFLETLLLKQLFWKTWIPNQDSKSIPYILNILRNVRHAVSGFPCYTTTSFCFVGSTVHPAWKQGFEKPFNLVNGFAFFSVEIHDVHYVALFLTSYHGLVIKKQSVEHEL